MGKRRKSKGAPKGPKFHERPLDDPARQLGHACCFCGGDPCRCTTAVKWGRK